MSILQTKTVTSLVSKCQLGVICIGWTNATTLLQRGGKGEHDGKSQQYNHVCSSVVSPHPRHSDKLKHGVLAGADPERVDRMAS